MQAAHSQAVRERDHHAETAKREAANAAASKAEAVQLRDALAQKNATGTAASAAHAADAQELEAVKVRVSRRVCVRFLSYSVECDGSWVDCPLPSHSQAALAQMLRERDAAEARARHEAVEAAAAKDAAEKAARENTELREAAARASASAKQEHDK